MAECKVEGCNNEANSTGDCGGHDVYPPPLTQKFPFSNEHTHNHPICDHEITREKIELALELMRFTPLTDPKRSTLMEFDKCYASIEEKFDAK